jgi:hypothetical protein
MKSPVVQKDHPGDGDAAQNVERYDSVCPDVGQGLLHVDLSVGVPVDDDSSDLKRGVEEPCNPRHLSERHPRIDPRDELPARPPDPTSRAGVPEGGGLRERMTRARLEERSKTR